jgi:glycosyltransferase involved in cell wall biosynthesis
VSKKTSFVLGDQGPSGYFRIALPCAALSEAGVDAGFAFSRQDFAAADTLVFQRQHKPGAVEEIFKWQSRGKKIVVDFDDNFLQLDPTNKARLVYTPEVVADLLRLIRAADAVTVATKPLAELYGEYAKKVYHIPNALPPRAFAKIRRPSDKVIIGWHGSDSHFSDLKLVKSALAQIQRRHDIDLVLAGYAPPGFFKGAVFRPWVKFSPDLDYFDSFADFTIGICPLSKSPFNDCKSDLKWLEYSSLGIPVVASAAPPYDSIEPGVTGLLARNLSDWEGHLSRLLGDDDLRLRMGRAAHDEVRAHRGIEGNIPLWQEVLAGL